MDPKAIHEKALAAAQKASDDIVAQYGADHKAFWFCGFAWVRIKPARGKFVQFLKDNRLGYAAYNGGWNITPPITFPPGPICQSMELKEAAGRAYAEVLKEEGMDAWMECRAD